MIPQYSGEKMKKTILILSLMALGATSLFATDLWNQTVPNYGYVNSFVNQNFTDFPAYSAYMVSDVVASQNWNVNQVSIDFFTNGSTETLGSTWSCTLNVFSNTGSLPSAGNDPTTGTTVTGTITNLNGSGYGTLTVSGLNLNLAAGEYWIGLTPTASFGNDGEFYLGESNTNTAGANYTDAFINPGGGFGLGSSWANGNTLTGDGLSYYGGIDVQGTVQSVPEPASIAALGLGLVGLIFRRRRK